MFLLFAVFAGYFYYDGKVGYKNKNAKYYAYMGYLQAKQSFKNDQILAKNGKEAKITASEETWKQFVQDYKVKVYEGHSMKNEVEDVDGCFPEGHAFPQTIPSVFADGYDAMLNDVDGASYEIWKKYTSEKGLEISADKYFKSRSTIEGQFNWAIGSGVLATLALFFLVRTSRRSMSVDAEAYYSPNGQRVPFASIYKIDRRKWARKGLAYLYYKDDADHEKKARVDGMVYGQFDKENPQNAEKLFQLIEKNLSVDTEIIDYAEEEEDEDTGE